MMKSDIEEKLEEKVAKWATMNPFDVTKEILLTCLAHELVLNVSKGRNLAGMAALLKIHASMNNHEQGTLRETVVNLPEKVDEALQKLRQLKSSGGIGSQQCRDLMDLIRFETEYQDIPTVMELAERVEQLQSKLIAKTDFKISERKEIESEETN